MASTWPSLLFHLIHIPVIVSLLLVTTQAETTINLGLSLYANDDSITWNSSSGDFAFGFRKYPNQADQFFLAIWFAKIPNKTVVWSANASNPVPRGSKLELTTSGQLMLTNPGGGEIWATTNNYNNFIEPSEAAMLDSGNFVIRGKNSSMIWESFRNPTNTILPTQVLNFGDMLSSGQILGGSFSPGKFELVLLTGHMVLQRVDPETGHVYGVYDDFPNVTQLISNESGDIYANRSDNSTVLFASWSSIPTSQRFYHRTTLDYDGTFTRYIHPRDFNSNESWSVAPGSVVPDNICMLPAAQITLGSGPCGFNSYCEPDGFGKPICGCPPSFSFVDQANLYSGCKQNDAGYIQQLCEEEGSTSGENLFDFDTMDGVDWPEADYELRSPSTEDDCRRACAIDTHNHTHNPTRY